MEPEEDAEEARLRKRRRRSVRNLRRRSAILPFNINELEETEEKTDTVTVPTQEDDMYGSLWMETDEPVHKKKRRRSSMYIGLMAGHTLPQISQEDLVCEAGEAMGQTKATVPARDDGNSMQYNASKDTCSLVGETNNLLGNSEEINIDKFTHKHSNAQIPSTHEASVTENEAAEKFTIPSKSLATSITCDSFIHTVTPNLHVHDVDTMTVSTTTAVLEKGITSSRTSLTSKEETATDGKENALNTPLRTHNSDVTLKDNAYVELCKIKHSYMHHTENSTDNDQKPSLSTSENLGNFDTSLHNNSLDNSQSVSLSSVSDNSHISLDLSCGFSGGTETPQTNLKRRSSPQSMSPEFPQSPTGLLYLGNNDDSYISMLPKPEHTDVSRSPSVKDDHTCSALVDRVDCHKTDDTSTGKNTDNLESSESIDLLSDKENNSLLSENNSLTNQSNTSQGLLSICKTFAGKVVDFVKTSPSYLADMISDSNKVVLLDSNTNAFASPQLKQNLILNKSSDCSKSEIDRLLTSMEHVDNMTAALETDVAAYAVTQSFGNNSPVSVETVPKGVSAENDVNYTVKLSNKAECMLGTDSDQNGSNNSTLPTDRPHTSGSSSCSSARKKRKERRSTSRAFFDTFNAISVELNRDRTEELQTSSTSLLEPSSGKPLKTPVSHHPFHTVENTNEVISSVSSVENLTEHGLLNVDCSKPDAAGSVDIETKIRNSKPDNVAATRKETPKSSQCNTQSEGEFASICLVTQRRKLSPVTSLATENERTAEPAGTNVQATNALVNINRDGINVTSDNYKSIYNKIDKQMANNSASKVKKAKLSKDCSPNPHLPIIGEANVEIEATSNDQDRNKKPSKRGTSRRRSAKFTMCTLQERAEQIFTNGSETGNTDTLNGDKISVKRDAFTASNSVDIETKIRNSKPDNVAATRKETPKSSQCNTQSEGEFASICLVTQRRKLSPVISLATENERNAEPAGTNVQATNAPVNINRDGIIVTSDNYKSIYNKIDKQMANNSASKVKKAKLSKDCSPNPHLPIIGEANVEIEATSNDQDRNKKPSKRGKSRRRSAKFTTCTLQERAEQIFTNGSETGNTDTLSGDNISVKRDAFTASNKHGVDSLQGSENKICDNTFSLNLDQKSQTTDTQKMEEKMSQLDICTCSSDHPLTEEPIEIQATIDTTKTVTSVESESISQNNVFSQCSNANISEFTLKSTCTAETGKTKGVTKSVRRNGYRKQQRLEQTNKSPCVGKAIDSKQKTSRSKNHYRRNKSKMKSDSLLEEDCMVVDVIHDISEFQIKDTTEPTPVVQQTTMDIGNSDEVVVGVDSVDKFATCDKMLPSDTGTKCDVSQKEIGNNTQLDRVNTLSSETTEPTCTTEQVLTVDDISLPDDRPAPRRRRRQSADAATLKMQMLAEGIDIASPADSPNTGPTTAIKPKRKRKNEPEIPLEHIYLNKNYQKPEIKKWEAVWESPKDNGLYYGKRKMQTYLDFENPTQMKLKKRLQRAVKNGWDPKRRKRSVLSDNYVTSKLSDVWSNLDDSGSESLEGALKAIIDTE